MAQSHCTARVRRNFVVEVLIELSIQIRFNPPNTFWAIALHDFPSLVLQHFSFSRTQILEPR
jgi:hypothetical protein